MGVQIFTIGLFLFIISPICHGSWGTPGHGQYHIQTDEGPERFFRYQTDNGQFRKEKRLADGTVIGTDAWIDASGMLWQKDYIADSKGYRILKSKTIYVGNNIPIDEAMKKAKSYPVQSGTYAKHPNIISPFDVSTSGGFYSSQPVSTTPASLYPTYSTPSPTPHHVYPKHIYYSTPKVYIRPHSQPVDSGYYSSFSEPVTTNRPTPTEGYYPSVTNTASPSPIRVPASFYEPPFEDNSSPAYSSSTLPSPISGDFKTPIAVYPYTPTTNSPQLSTTTSSYPSSNTGFSSSTGSIPISTTLNSGVSTYPNDVFSYDHGISSTTPRPFSIESSTPRSVIPIAGNDINARPVYTRSSTSSTSSNTNHQPYRYGYGSYGNYGVYGGYGQPASNNQLVNGYDPRFPFYNGVHDTDSGFQYFLPRHYHEEKNLDYDKKQGSFGYVDPFGIRRVVYYKASPEGFIHRKNNRYVGLNAAPYDPQP